MIGAFSLGNALPNLQSFAEGQGAAYYIYEVIDRVSRMFGSDGRVVRTFTRVLPWRSSVTHVKHFCFSIIFFTFMHSILDIMDFGGPIYHTNEKVCHFSSSLGIS